MEEPMDHALKVRVALAQGNYGRFFKLYRNAPNMGSCLIDVFIDKFRVLSLRNLALGYVATGLDLGYFTATHAFESQDHAEKFLRETGCVISTTQDG